MTNNQIVGRKPHRDTTLDLFAQPAQGPPPFTTRTPIFRVELVKEGEYEGPPCRTPEDIARLLARYLGKCDREYFVAVLLSTSCKVIGLHTVSIGTINAALVSPREVMRVALLANAAQLVVSHCHPSGNLEPSREDIQVTKRLVEAGKLMDVSVVDHIIVGHDGRYTSLAERGLM